MCLFWLIPLPVRGWTRTKLNSLPLFHSFHAWLELLHRLLPFRVVWFLFAFVGFSFPCSVAIWLATKVTCVQPAHTAPPLVQKKDFDFSELAAKMIVLCRCSARR